MEERDNDYCDNLIRDNPELVDEALGGKVDSCPDKEDITLEDLREQTKSQGFGRGVQIPNNKPPNKKGTIYKGTGGGKGVLNLASVEDFFGGTSPISTVLVHSICLEWLCTPMVGDTVWYKENKDNGAQMYTCENWYGNIMKNCGTWMEFGIDLLNLGIEDKANKTHISNIRWMGKLSPVGPGNKGGEIKSLPPASLFIGNILLQKIQRKETSMEVSFTNFINKTNFTKRMPYYKIAYNITFTNNGYNLSDADAAAKLEDILMDDKVLEKLVTLWANNGPYTFPVGKDIEGRVEPRQRVMGGELIHTIFGDSNNGDVQRLITLIRNDNNVPNNKDKIECIFTGTISPRQPMLNPALEEDVKEENKKDEEDLLEYLKHLSVRVTRPVDEKEGEKSKKVFEKINKEGIYMIVNLPSHGHTALVFFKNNKIYTAGGGLWGPGGSDNFLVNSPDDSMFVTEGGSVNLDKFHGSFGKGDGNKKWTESNVITKIGYINSGLIGRLDEFIEDCEVPPDWKIGDEVIQSKTYNYSLWTLNYYFEKFLRPKGRTLSCITWAWYMVTGGLPSIINISSPQGGRMERFGGGSRKNTRRKRRRKRKHTKRSKPNTKKKTKKHRKKRKYTKSRR